MATAVSRKNDILSRIHAKAGDWVPSGIIKSIDHMNGTYSMLSGSERARLKASNIELLSNPINANSLTLADGGSAVINTTDKKDLNGGDIFDVDVFKNKWETLFWLLDARPGAIIRISFSYEIDGKYFLKSNPLVDPLFPLMRVSLSFDYAATLGSNVPRSATCSFPLRKARQLLTGSDILTTDKNSLIWLPVGAEFVKEVETRQISSTEAVFIFEVEVPLDAGRMKLEITPDYGSIDLTDLTNIFHKVSSFRDPKGSLFMSKVSIKKIGGVDLPDNVDQAFDDLSNRAQSGVAIATQLTAITKSFNELSLDIKAQLQSNVGTIGNRIDAVTVILTTWLSTLADDLGTEHHVVYATAAEAPITDDVILTNGPDGKVLIHLRDDAGLIQPLSAYMTTNVNIDFAEAKLTAYAANLKTMAITGVIATGNYLPITYAYSKDHNLPLQLKPDYLPKDNYWPNIDYYNNPDGAVFPHAILKMDHIAHMTYDMIIKYGGSLPENNVTGGWHYAESDKDIQDIYLDNEYGFEAFFGINNDDVEVVGMMTPDGTPWYLSPVPPSPVPPEESFKWITKNNILISGDNAFENPSGAKNHIKYMILGKMLVGYIEIDWTQSTGGAEGNGQYSIGLDQLGVIADFDGMPNPASAEGGMPLGTMSYYDPDTSVNLVGQVRVAAAANSITFAIQSGSTIKDWGHDWGRLTYRVKYLAEFRIPLK